MKILIIGGTGGTGIELIKQALEQGHTVAALVRSPERVKISDENLYVLKGNVLKLEDFKNAVAGQDAVLSSLGHKRFFIKTNILSEGTKNIIRAMEKHAVKRFICITSLGINDSRFRMGWYYTLFVIPFILFFYFRDKAKQENLIRESGLDWTIVRPGQLTNGQKRENYKHGDNLGSYVLTRMISRANVADFMLRQLSDKTYIRATPGIVN